MNTRQSRPRCSRRRKRALFDAEARHWAGVSGEEFLRRWDAGDYRDIPDTPEGRRIMRVIYLIPFGRQ
jgi:hypothetical protein